MSISHDQKEQFFDAVLSLEPDDRIIILIILLDQEYDIRPNTNELAELFGISQPAFWGRLGRALFNLGIRLKGFQSTQEWLAEEGYSGKIDKEDIAKNVLRYLRAQKKEEFVDTK